jgi:2-aminoethylphosphonate-pyruvate transaminase
MTRDDIKTPGGEPFLLTPGPLTTSLETKQAMLRDWGSRDSNFIEAGAEIRQRLLAMTGAGDDYDCVLMQGSGTFSIEAALSSFVPKDGKVLVLINGVYGKRALKILEILGRETTVLERGDYLPPQPEAVKQKLLEDEAISDVFVVHCETSSGILNPLKEIADVVHDAGRRLIIDAMSSFGAIPLEVSEIPYEAMVSSANKCIEGVPGFGFTIARKAALEGAKGRSHSLSLDLHEQWAYTGKSGQWRFTPPTHAIMAFREALRQHEAEGGVTGRGARYRANMEALVKGMRAMGFETLLDDEEMAPVIITFLNPADPAFDFMAFYNALKARNFVIYPGQLTQAQSFRIGCIGQIHEPVVTALLETIRECIEELGVTSCKP